MKREMVISPAPQVPQLKNISGQLAEWMRMPLLWLSAYYSSVLERKVSLRQTLLLVNAQMAFFFTVFPVAGPLLLRLLCCAWLLHAVLKCKQAMR